MKTLSIKLKFLALMLVLVLVSLFSAGCGHRYKGDYPELCSVAWSNIPMLNGGMSNGEVVYDPEISVLETDTYGRVLFSYTEDIDRQYFYILIMQRTDGQYAYYYPDDCYTKLVYEERDSKPDASAEEVTALKSLNDWECPMDESKQEATAVIDKKPTKGKLKLKDNDFEPIIREYHESSGRYIHPKNSSFVRWADYVKSDAYGREMYVVNTDFKEYYDKKEISYVYSFLVIVQPDKSYDLSTVVILESSIMPQQVKVAKQQNGWNTAR